MGDCPPAKKSNQQQGETVSLEVAQKRARWREEASARYRRDWHKIRAQRKANRDHNVERFREESRMRYRRRMAKIGRTVKELRSRRGLTPEMILSNARKRQNEWGRENKNRRRQYSKNWWKSLTDEQRQAQMARREAYHKMYRQREKEKRRKWSLAYLERKKNDVRFQIGRRIRARIRMAIKRAYGKKAFRSMEMLGCTVEEARRHLESTFTDGMNWERFLAGEIDIDHIKPVCSFDLTKPEEQKKCFHWSNIQALWEPDNLKKGSKMPLPTSGSVSQIQHG